jgi:hypothetical protein
MAAPTYSAPCWQCGGSGLVERGTAPGPPGGLYVPCPACGGVIGTPRRTAGKTSWMAALAGLLAAVVCGGLAFGGVRYVLSHYVTRMSPACEHFEKSAKASIPTLNADRTNLPALESDIAAAITELRRDADDSSPQTAADMRAMAADLQTSLTALKRKKPAPSVVANRLGSDGAKIDRDCGA